MSGRSTSQSTHRDAVEEVPGNGPRLAERFGRAQGESRRAAKSRRTMDSEFYSQARREWDERYGDLVLTENAIGRSRRRA